MGAIEGPVEKPDNFMPGLDVSVESRRDAQYMSSRRHALTHTSTNTGVLPPQGEQRSGLIPMVPSFGVLGIELASHSDRNTMSGTRKYTYMAYMPNPIKMCLGRNGP